MGAFDIVIGGDAQPDTGFSIVMGTTASSASSVLEIPMPSAAVGELALAFIVRNGVLVSPPGWEPLNLNGAGDRYLEIFAHTVTAFDVATPGQIVKFGSLTDQELQGQIVIFEGASATSVIEDIANAPFTADATPSAPTPITQQAISAIVLVFSADGSVAFTAPAGFTELDSYGSAVIASRSLLIATKRANITGTIPVFDAAAAPAATGRAWAVILRNGPPLTPPELFDPVAGHIGIV